MDMDRISPLVDHILMMTAERHAAAIVQALPEDFEVESLYLPEPFVPTREEILFAAAQIEADWAKRFEPLPPFDTLEPAERTRWEGYAQLNCSHLAAVPAGHAEALYVENHGQEPDFAAQRNDALAPEERWSPGFPRFTDGNIPYVEEYLSVEEMPISRLREMNGRHLEFPIPRGVRVYEENTRVSLRKGRAWPLFSVLLEGKVQSAKALESEAWISGKAVGSNYRVHLAGLPTRCLLVEVWQDRGDDGHLEYELSGFAVMTQVQFAEYLVALSAVKYRRREQSDAERIIDQFGSK